jgi:hypothetical protein
MTIDWDAAIMRDGRTQALPAAGTPPPPVATSRHNGPCHLGELALL